MRALSLLLLISLSGFLFACDSNPGRRESDTSLSAPSLEEGAKDLAGEEVWNAEDDANFLREAYKHNLQIIRLCEVAESLSNTAALRNFAGQSVQYYKNLNGQIELMGGKFSTSPDTTTAEESEKLRGLQEKRGKDFEVAYLKQLGKLIDQQNDIFEEASEKAYNNTIRNWAAKITSNLNAHSTAVEELAEDL